LLCEFDGFYRYNLSNIIHSPSSKLLLIFTHPAIGLFQLRGGFEILKERPTYVDGSNYAMGGETFDDKVQSISKSLLERKKVAPSVQKDYGKTYNKQEALDSARRIVGSMVKKSKN
jgi:hypothetical protein